MASSPDHKAAPGRGTGPPAGPPIRRAGFVAIVGRPNVGKSTLLNQVLGEKLAIATPRPQTTRNRLLGIKIEGEAQLALVDTPGLHRTGGRGRTALNRFMVEEALQALDSVDVVLLVAALPAAAAPAPEALDAGDRFALECIQERGKPAVLALNKVDLLKDKRLLLPRIGAFTAAHPFRAVVPISARTGYGVPELVAELCALLPAGPALFPPDMLTDQAERFLVAERIREQVFLATRQEVPYAVAVSIDAWEERQYSAGRKEGERCSVRVSATVHVEKETQKKILVGEGGRTIRDLGTAARAEIGRLLGCAAHLSLFVRVDRDWSDRPAALREFGYSRAGADKMETTRGRGPG